MSNREPATIHLKSQNAMEIITSKVSVYEIELNLNKWDRLNSKEVPEFYGALKTTIHSLALHKCMNGKIGGFLSEVRKGTNFAHVIEHVILELIHLADPAKEIYSGWTRKKEANTYIIHYRAPDFLTGRLAAMLGVDVVKRIINGEPVDINRYVDLLRQPLNYFIQDTALSEPVSVIQELEDSFERNLVKGFQLTDDQLSGVSIVLKRIRKHLKSVAELWEKTFLDYSGDFGKAIIDKIELINIDKFIDLLEAGDFQSVFRGMKNISQVIHSYRIPMNFVVYSIWLYKNNLMNFITEEYEGRKTQLYQIVQDFDAFFQMILQSVSDGFILREPVDNMNYFRELKEFREIRERKGCILVVDDDEMTRRALRDILEYQGYNVLLAENGPKALAMLGKRIHDISLITLDLVMPGMNGRQVYEKIKALNPNARILVTSGYPSDSQTRSFYSGKWVDFIQKPFRTEELLQKVQELLNSHGNQSTGCRTQAGASEHT